MILKLIGKKEIEKSVKSFIFEPNTPISWTSGQYLIYSLPHKNQDLRGKMRFFTISSSPFQKHPAITTRIDKNSSSFKKALNNLKFGDTIEAKGPDGDFVLSNLNKDYVFIAGGIGITPFMAIIRQLDFEKKMTDITLLYANRDNNIVFGQELEEIAKINQKLKINYFISPRRIDKNVLRKYLNKKTMFYISGPDPMVYAMEELLVELGINKKDIQEDYFSGYKKI